MKVLNSTLAGLREERDRAVTDRDNSYSHLEATKKLCQQLQCELDDQNGVMKSLKQSHFLAEKNSKEMIDTERRVAFDQVRECESRLQL